MWVLNLGNAAVGLGVGLCPFGLGAPHGLRPETTGVVIFEFLTLNNWSTACLLRLVQGHESQKHTPVGIAAGYFYCVKTFATNTFADEGNKVKSIASKIKSSSSLEIKYIAIAQDQNESNIYTVSPSPSLVLELRVTAYSLKTTRHEMLGKVCILV